MDLSISSEVLPEVKEFERTSTTVINAYVKPVVAHYLSNLETRLAGMGLTAPITVMQSSGGTVRTGAAKERPVYSIESVLPRAWWGRRSSARAWGWPTSSRSTWVAPRPRPASSRTERRD